MASTQKILVSVNLSLFGNTTYRNDGMCSFNFFLYSSNIEAPPFERLAEQFLKEHGFTTALMAELVNLIKKYKTAEGNLLQIFVPKAKVDDCAYICYGWGIPCDNVLDKACWDPVKKRHTRIRPILDRYCSNPNSLPNIDRLQARLVMTSSTFLNPDSGIKIFRYTTLSKERKKQYKAELRAIIEKVVINAIEIQKSIPQSCPFGRLVRLIASSTNPPATKAATVAKPIYKPLYPTAKVVPTSVTYKKAALPKKSAIKSKKKPIRSRK